MALARALAFALVALSLAGCIGGGGPTVTAIYELSAPANPPVASGSSAQILVPEPSALQFLASNRIAVKPSPITLAYYPEVAYQDEAPKVLQRILLDTFQNSGRVSAVGLPGQSLLINYRVVTEVRAFQAETFDGNRARVAVAAKLLNDANGQVLRTRVFETVVGLSGDDAENAARGLNAAVQALATDVVNWVLAAI